MTAIRATKKTAPSEAEKGVPLAPSAKDLNPWYSDKARDRGQIKEDQEDDRRQVVCHTHNRLLTVSADKEIFALNL